MSVGAMSEEAILEFKGGNWSSLDAANHFAKQAWPEPREVCDTEGEWTPNYGFQSLEFDGWFYLRGGRQRYRLTYTAADKLWRVYRVARKQQR